jgi:hypothetical protein
MTCAQKVFFADFAKKVVNINKVNGTN